MEITISGLGFRILSHAHAEKACQISARLYGSKPYLSIESCQVGHGHFQLALTGWEL